MHEACIALQDVARIVDGEVNKESLLGWNLEQDPRDLRNAQTAAKKKRGGLWSEKSPISPWEFRKTPRQVLKT